VMVVRMEMERGGKVRHSQCPDLGELPDGSWAFVHEYSLDLCFATRSVVRWCCCFVCSLDLVDLWTKRGVLRVGWLAI